MISKSNVKLVMCDGVFVVIYLKTMYDKTIIRFCDIRNNQGHCNCYQPRPWARPMTLWALSIYEKNPEISVVAKVEFPIGKKLFHLVVNPGTSRCPTVDLELVQTTRTRHSVRKFQPGKRAHPFRFSTFSGNFPVGWADETCSIYRRTGNSGNFD